MAKTNCSVNSNLKLKLLTTIPEKYTCHVEQQFFYFFTLVRCILTAVRTKTSMLWSWYSYCCV